MFKYIYTFFFLLNSTTSKPNPKVHATLSSIEQYINSHTPTHTFDVGQCQGFFFFFWLNIYIYIYISIKIVDPCYLYPFNLRILLMVVCLHAIWLWVSYMLDKLNQKCIYVRIYIHTYTHTHIYIYIYIGIVYNVQHGFRDPLGSCAQEYWIC